MGLGGLQRFAVGRVLARISAAILGAMIALFGASPAFAQQTFTYVNSTDASVNESATPCANPLLRTFSVSDSFTIDDVDVGVLITHTYRGDLVMALEHPDGTRIQIVNGSGSIWGNNFNVLLNDEGTQTVNTDFRGTNHSSSQPSGGGFQNNFIPNSALSAFDGKNSSGTWTLEVCDQFGGDSGTFLHTELYLTGTVALTNIADLSITKAVSDSSPANGDQITYTLTVTNSSSSDLTTGATVTDVLPSGAQYVAHSGYGTYVPGTGVWTLASIAPGQSRQLTIDVDVLATAGASITNAAEITSSDENDPDSTPGNGVTSEDDYDTASFTVSGSRVAGTPPTLVCPDGSLPFAWSSGDWTGGTTNNDVTVTDLGPVNWDLQLPSGASWLSISTYGGAHPRLTTVPQSTLSLSVAVEFTNPTQLATITIDIGEVTEGVQFTVFDVDYINNDFADYIRVTGYRDGVQSAIPVLTNGVANYVIGNEAFGDQGSSDSQSNGNVVVTFSDPIDEIVIEYGNHSLAPSDPDGQAIQFPGLFSFCKPVADLLVVKSSSVEDDQITTGGNDPFAIPGAVMRYCIQMTNNGSATARDINAADPLPANVSYNSGTIFAGANCSAATNAEDDNAAGVDETDTYGASFAGGTLDMYVASLADGETAAFVFDVTVQ